jgi:hypothetical protein
MQKRILNEIPTVPLRGRILSSTRKHPFLYESFLLVLYNVQISTKKTEIPNVYPPNLLFNVTKYHDYIPAYNQFNP